jgi:hypothetical protein
MAKPNEVTESSMEEILASIRKIISEDESKASGAKPLPDPTSDEDDPASDDLASNVSRLFGDHSPETATEPSVDPERDPLEKLQEVEVVRRNGPTAMSETRGERVNSEGRSEPPSSRDALAVTSDKLPATNSTGSLLSPGADAAVASAFSQLASTILTNNSRTVEELAEEMMRPMLKDWLDENLPPMVERLVREEIERVSRRR